MPTYENFFKLLDMLGLKVTTLPMTGASNTLHNLDTKETLYVSLDPLAKPKLKRFSFKSIFITINILFSIKRLKSLFEDGEFEGKTMEEALRMVPQLREESFLLLVFDLALVASMHYDELMEAPATHFMGKLIKHFSTAREVSGWRVINFRTDTYIKLLSKPFREKIVLSSDIKSVARTDDDVTLTMGDGSKSVFDKVIFACYADQALKLLEQPTKAEKRILSVWTYNDGPMVVHKDNKLFPEADFLSLYEFLYTGRRDHGLKTSINVSYGYEVGVDDDCGYLGTQYPNFPIDEDLIEFHKVFRTPIYTNESMHMIDELPKLNGGKNSYYCGSHFGYGLHEDAVTSAIDVVKMLGVKWLLGRLYGNSRQPVTRFGGLRIRDPHSNYGAEHRERAIALR